MTPLLIYLLVGWALAALAYFTTGQYTPEKPGAPKWMTVLAIITLWPLLCYLIWRDKRR